MFKNVLAAVQVLSTILVCICAEPMAEAILRMIGG
jgi:hypothetical protein